MLNQSSLHGRLQIMLGTAGMALLAAAALADGDAAAGQTSNLVPRVPVLTYPQAVLVAEPVAYWRLNEIPGAKTAADATAHHHDGKFHGKPHLGEPGAFPSGKDTAMGLDGPKSKSYVEIPANKVFSVPTSGKGLTVEVWLRPDALTFAGENSDPANPYIYWLGKGEKGAFEWGFRFYSKESNRPNRISAYIWNLAGGEGAGAYVEGELKKHQWIYLVATFDDPSKPNPRVQIYKNGEPSEHNSSPGTLYKSYDVKPVAGKAPVRLGTRDLGGFLTGGLDEVAIYPYVLTPEQIRQHWALAGGTKQVK
jgi:hypothetical protein